VFRSHLKKVFCPHLCVGRSLQALEIPTYSSGLNFAAALIWNQNPNFEMTSSKINFFYLAETLNSQHSSPLARHSVSEAVQFIEKITLARPLSTPLIK
jgi:hypothetical protein